MNGAGRRFEESNVKLKKETGEKLLGLKRNWDKMLPCLSIQERKEHLLEGQDRKERVMRQASARNTP